MSSGKCHRCGSDLTLLWLWPAAIAPIRHLAWEPPYAAGVALKKKKKRKPNKYPNQASTDYILNYGKGSSHHG